MTFANINHDLCTCGNFKDSGVRTNGDAYQCDNCLNWMSGLAIKKMKNKISIKSEDLFGYVRNAPVKNIITKKGLNTLQTYKPNDEPKYENELKEIAKKFEIGDIKINWSFFKDRVYNFVVFSKSEFEKHKNEEIAILGLCNVRISQLEADFTFERSNCAFPQKFIEDKFKKAIKLFEHDNAEYWNPHANV